MRTWPSRRLVITSPLGLALSVAIIACAPRSATSNESPPIWLRCDQWREAVISGGEEKLGAELVGIEQRKDGADSIITGSLLPYLAVKGAKYYLTDLAQAGTPRVFQAHSPSDTLPLYSTPQALGAKPVDNCTLANGEIAVAADTRDPSNQSLRRIRYFKEVMGKEHSLAENICPADKQKSFSLRNNRQLLIGEMYAPSSNSFLVPFTGFALSCNADGNPKSPDVKGLSHRLPRMNVRFAQGATHKGTLPKSIDLFKKDGPLLFSRLTARGTVSSSADPAGRSLTTLGDVVEVLKEAEPEIKASLREVLGAEVASLEFQKLMKDSVFSATNGGTITRTAAGNAANILDAPSETVTPSPAPEAQKPTVKPEPPKSSPVPEVLIPPADLELQSDLPDSLLGRYLFNGQPPVRRNGKLFVPAVEPSSTPYTVSHASNLCKDTVFRDPSQNLLRLPSSKPGCVIVHVEPTMRSALSFPPDSCVFDAEYPNLLICPPRTSKLTVDKGWEPFEIAVKPGASPVVNFDTGSLRPFWPFHQDPAWTGQINMPGLCGETVPTRIQAATVQYCRGEQCGAVVKLPVPPKAQPLPTLIDAGWKGPDLPNTVRLGIQGSSNQNSNPPSNLSWSIGQTDTTSLTARLEKEAMARTPSQMPVRLESNVAYNPSARLGLFRNKEACTTGSSPPVREVSFDREATRALQADACTYSRVRNGDRLLTLCTKAELVGPDIVFRLTPKDFGERRRLVIVEETGGFGEALRDTLLKAFTQWSKQLQTTVKTARPPVTLMQTQSNASLHALFDAEDLIDLPWEIDQAQMDSVRQRLTQLGLRDGAAQPISVLQEVDYLYGKRLQQVVLVAASRLPERLSATDRGLPRVWKDDGIHLTVFAPAENECRRWRDLGAECRELSAAKPPNDLVDQLNRLLNQ